MSWVAKSLTTPTSASTGKGPVLTVEIEKTDRVALYSNAASSHLVLDCIFQHDRQQQ